MTWEYAVHVLIVIGIYAILSQSFNLTFGVGRLFNLAHVASYAIGAYTAALLSVNRGWGFFGCLAAGAALCALFSLIIGAISSRLSSDYFAIGTLAFNALVSALLVNWQSVTRGVLGISGIPRPEFAGIDFVDNTNFLILTFLVLLLVQAALYIVFHNSFARTLVAQAESEPAALSLAIRASRTRALSFMLASSCAGVAGVLFAYYLNYIDPTSFSLSEGILVLSIVVIGGPASFWGVLAATAALIMLPEGIRFIGFINERPQLLGPLRQMSYALILFITVYINRARLFPVQREV